MTSASTRSAFVLALASAVVSALAIDAGAGSTGAQPTVDLRDQANVVLGGLHRGAAAGYAVGGLGDVNGDGHDDLAVGAPGASALGRLEAGAVYVVLGPARSPRVNLRGLGRGGFRLIGEEPGSAVGTSVAAAGDVNGDGLGDLITRSERGPSGTRAHVVFGSRSPRDVDLGRLGSAGFTIDRRDSELRIALSVAGAGDVNADGRTNLIVSANEPDGSESAYVVFGRSSTEPVDLGRLGSGGFLIKGLDAEPSDDVPVAGAGDINGDGHADVLVGIESNGAAHPAISGEAYVIFGGSGADTVDVTHLRDRGFRIAGLDGAGSAVSSAGDVNGDQRPDALVGGKGFTAVVLGSRSGAAVDLRRPGGRGFLISRPGELVLDAAGIGDFDRDGLDDIAVGYPLIDPPGRFGAGSTYVVDGQRSTAPVDLRRAGDNIFRIDGPVARASIGDSVAGAGDVNDDGGPDLLVGAVEARPDPAGAAYVLFGAGPPLVGISRRTSVLAAYRGRVIRVPVTCPANADRYCRGALTLVRQSTARGRQRSRSRALARTHFSLAAGSGRLVALGLSREAQQALRRHRRLRVTATAVAWNMSRRRGHTARALTLTLP